MTATQLLGLPAEILYAIADNFEYASDLNNFTQTCRHVYSVLTPRLEHSFMPAPTPENIHHIIIEGNTLSLARMLSLKSVQGVQMANVLSLGRMASEHCQFKILELLVELYGSAWYIEDVLDHAADWCPVLDEALRQDCSKLLETLNVHLSSRPGDSNRMIRLLNAATSGGLTALVVYLASRARDKNLGTFSFAARFNPPLLTAASSGQLTCLRSLIEGFCISSDTSQSRTPLKIQDQFLLLASRLIYVAAASGHDEVVRYLLQTNAVDVLRENPDIEGLNECFLKSSDVSRELTVDLFHGLPDIETLNGSSLRSFHISNESAVELILAELRDLSFHMSTPEGKAHPRAFLWAIFTNNIISVQRLLESGHVPQDEPGNTPALALRRGLNLAIRRCHVNICELILAKLTTANAPIGTSQYMEHLSLALATKNASIARDKIPEIAEAVLDRCWQLTGEHHGEPSMITFLGLLFDFPPIIERMIHAYNLSVSGFEEVDEEMENVPSIASLPNRILKEAAAAFGSIKVFNSLLTRCPLSLPHPGARGFNLAFYLAHFTFQPEILKVFLDLGFKPNLFPYMFDDPPDWVVLVGPRESSIIIRPLESISTPQVLATIRLLIDYGADVNQLSSSGTTALWSAVAMYESQEIFEDLLRHGADPLAGSDPSLTALHSAITSRDFNLVRLFLEALSLRGRPLEHASFFLDAARVECEDNDDICGARISAAASVLRVLTHYHWRQIYPVPADPPKRKLNGYQEKPSKSRMESRQTGEDRSGKQEIEWEPPSRHVIACIE